MIPPELRKLPQWVTWRTEHRHNSLGVSIPTKVPYSPITGKRASSTNPETWASYREAVSGFSADGIGFVFASSDPYVGFDLDGCVSGTGAIHPAAHAIVDALNGYVEFSPSGHGLHIIVRARIDRGRHTLKTEWHNELALYSSGRFFTMTGQGYGDIRKAQEAVNYLVSYYFPEEEAHRKAPVARPAAICGDDRTVVDKLLAHPTASLLWAGDTSAHEGDHSAADLALLAHLAFYTGGDRSRMDSLFRASGLYREKWEREDYRERTIQKVLGG